MLYALGALLVLVVSESVALWYLWGERVRLRTALAGADSAGASLHAQLVRSQESLESAQRALAGRNEAERVKDVEIVRARPGVSDAVARFNGLQPARPPGAGRGSGSSL